MMDRLAVDSSTLIAYLAGETAKDTEILNDAVTQLVAYIPPVVISEVFSYPYIQPVHRLTLSRFGILTVEDNSYWERAAETRMKILRRKRKAHLPDALIAQSCIDHDVPLLTRDDDFRCYAEHCGLKLLGLNI